MQAACERNTWAVERAYVGGVNEAELYSLPSFLALGAWHRCGLDEPRADRRCISEVAEEGEVDGRVGCGELGEGV